MPKVYDCFTYFNEDLLLSLRLHTLARVVDRFVVAESTHTFTGKPKPIHFDPARFPEFRDRITHVVVDDMPTHLGDAWANEAHQRNALLRGLTDAASDDWIMISDVDEIPRPEAIVRYRPWNLSATFIQRHYNYFLNNLAVRSQESLEPRWWVRPKITTLSHLRNFFGTPENLRVFKREPGLSGTVQYLQRKLRHQRLAEGGWHFAWMMTPEQMVHKLESFSHTEFDRPHIKSVAAITSAIQAGRDIMGKGERFRLVEVDDTFPIYLREHFDRFRDWYLNPQSNADARSTATR